MDLILWRHAEAEDGNDDLARTLTRRGHKQAGQMAAWLRDRLPTHYELWVSEARRSQQTAGYLRKDFRVERGINPDIGWADVLKAIDWPHGGSRTVVVVGHQPYIGRIASSLLCEQPLYFSVKKGSVWWLQHKAHGDLEQVRLRVMMPVSMLQN